jgi:predicted RecB family endonuclease
MDKINKKIDLKNVNSFLPDNFTICTKEYWDNKFNGMLPDGMTELLETLSRKEHDEIDEIEMIELFKHVQINYINQINKEFDEAKNINHGN